MHERVKLAAHPLVKYLKPASPLPKYVDIEDDLKNCNKNFELKDLVKKTVILFTVTTFLIVIIIKCYIDNILFTNDEVILLPKKTMMHSGRQKTLLCNTFNCL